jgi:phosphoglycolate phosphatase
VGSFVAFDLDGVLYSAEPFLGEAYREAIARVNEQVPGAFPRVPATREILDHVGWPVPVILKRLFPAIAPRAVELLYQETLPIICEHVGRREGAVFPHVAETLGRLRADGYRLAVASNGRRAYVATVLSTHDLARYFVDLIAVEGGSKTTKGDLLREYMTRHEVAPQQMVMVGDRTSDVEAAREVGCAFVGCDYGHGYRDEVAGVGPVVSAFAELPEAIRSLGL